VADNAGKSDIDFDELDKAVNSLMGKVGNETLDDDGKTKTLAISTTLKPDDKVKYDQIGKVAEKIGDETLVTDGEVELVEDLNKLPDTMELPVATTATPAPTASASVAPPKPVAPRPNNGRFMDMVHPKADMRAPSVVAPATPPVAAAVIPAPAPEVVTPTPLSAPATYAPAQKQVPPSQRGLQPVAASAAPAPEAPLTPFLPDAKVEKRPLGGGSSIAVPAVSDGKLMGAQPLESLNFAAPETPVQPVPAETSSPANQLPPTPENSSGDALAEEQTLTKIEASEVTAVAEPAAPQGVPSIEKVESGDTEALKNVRPGVQEIADVGGTIYDVNAYHQPLNHPAKQKSGWGVVIVIVVIIILAVAVAGGAYLYFVPSS